LKHFLLLLEKWTLLLIAFLKPLGIWGALLTGVIDSSTIPLPMDILMATYVWNDRDKAWLYVLMAALGSVIGGLLPYFLGRAGGELFLLKRIDRARFEALQHKFERQEFVALLVPSMLPPPTPWKLFVFAAGVFEMKIFPFMGAVFLGRLVRFGVEAVLTVRYGPEVMSHTGSFLKLHAHLILAILGALVAAGAVWVALSLRRRRPGSLPQWRRR
jgi:membrane protein YqaA with SNARE-associated domain